MRRVLLLILLGVSLAWVAWSQGKVLRIAFDAADLKTLDPHLAAATMDRAVVDMVFNGLVRYKPGDISAPFEPDLAESWDVSKDGLTWTFYLRKGFTSILSRAIPRDTSSPPRTWFTRFVRPPIQAAPPTPANTRGWSSWPWIATPCR